VRFPLSLLVQQGKQVTTKRKEQAMYIAIRRMKVKPGELDEGMRRIENGFVPIISNVPGFVE
jgi:hypothetical protein